MKLPELGAGPFWGKDKRLCPRLTAWIQNLATFKSTVAPPRLILEFLGIRLNFPFNGKYWCFRVHLWRFDPYANAYVFFSSMFKAVQPTDPMP